jgi:hypothetical protein
MSTPPNTYTDTPIASNTLANDQPVIRSDITYLANTLGTSNAKNGDHQISFGGKDTDSFEGRHRQVCFNNRHVGAPTVAGIADGVNALLYADNGNIFFGSATGAGAFQLTNYNSTAGFGSVTTSGWTFLPGGLFLQYGQVSSPGSSGIVTFPLNFPSSNPPIMIQVSLERSSAGQTATIDSATAPTSSQFKYLTSSGGSVFLFWMAIGN